MGGADQAFAGRVRVWLSNLRALPFARLSLTATAAWADLPEPRRAALGDGAWIQQVRVSWAFPGEDRTAVEELWWTFVPGDAPSSARLAGDTDSPAAVGATPLWLQQPVRLHRRGALLVLTDDDGGDWWGPAEAAQRAVSTRLAAPAGGRDPVLVVEVPQSRTVFERVLGVAPGSYAGVAAAAWPMGPDPATAPIRVVVNPEAAGRLSTLGRSVLLTHEAVHVATRSPGSPAPTWLVEGYADQVAYAAFPAGRRPAEQAVRVAVRAGGPPDGWPREEDFAPDAGEVDLAYDLAWTAVDAVATAYGQDGLDRFYAAVDGGASVAEAARRIGTTEDALLRAWRTELDGLAGR